MAEEVQPAVAGEELRRDKLRRNFDKYRIQRNFHEDTKILYLLESIKMDTNTDLGLQLMDLDDILKCPSEISRGEEIYYWPHIRNWLNEESLNCPLSKADDPHNILRQHCLTQQLISQLGEEKIAEFEQAYTEMLLQEMSLTLHDQKRAAKELRTLTKKKPSYRAVLFNINTAIATLMKPITVNIDSDLQEDLITVILNLSKENNKKLIEGNPDIIPLLLKSTKYGSNKTKRYAGAAVFQLLQVYSFRTVIETSYALGLVQILREGPPQAKTEAASTIYNLCYISQNKPKFIEAGAVDMIVEMIKEGIVNNELLGILMRLSRRHQHYKLEEDPTLECLFQILRGSRSKKTRENCVTILSNVGLKNPNSLRVIRNLDAEKDTLAKIADAEPDKETIEAREKAGYIIVNIILLD